jgi:hypothetical protein
VDALLEALGAWVEDAAEVFGVGVASFFLAAGLAGAFFAGDSLVLALEEAAGFLASLALVFLVFFPDIRGDMSSA